MNLSLKNLDPARRWARIGFALLCLLAVVGFFVYPTYPNYDSYYSLLWGRELLDGSGFSFEAYRAPTEHPLAIAFVALLSPLGRHADRVLVACSFATFLTLVWGVYRLAATAFTPLVGGIAAVLLCTRLDFVSLALRGYIDVPFLAVVIWAAVLELRHPRRGAAVLLLLAAAGLMRPEAWLLSGLYFLWVAWRADWRRRVGYAVLAAIGPVVWAAVDYSVTGDPLFSLHSTSGLADALDRQQAVSDIPSSLLYFINTTVKPPVALAALAGLLLGVWFTPRRIVMPAVLLLSGVGTFVVIGLAGLSVIPRYLQVAALATLIFAAVALGGASMLRRDTTVRKVWVVAAILVAVYATFFTISRFSPVKVDSDLGFRGDANPELVKILNTPAVRDGLRCGPVSVPNHKLIPEVRWIADLGTDQVIARSDPKQRVRVRKGVALYVTGRGAIYRQVYAGNEDSPFIQLPLAGFRRVATSGYYSAYASCR